MDLLLDTHVVLWHFEGSPLLSAQANHLIRSLENRCFISHASLWEITIKLSNAKLNLDVSLQDFVTGIQRIPRFAWLLPDFSHYHHLLQLPWHHRDPFDRMLIAQARAESLTLLTQDRFIQQYDVPVIW